MEPKSITIKEIINECLDSEPWVLPNLQRPYVWKKEKIINFFDSLMQGYPVGMLLLWDIKDEEKVGFYRFLKSNDKSITNDKYECLDKDRPKAVLDGQQRITTLNIGLRGTFDDGMLYINLSKVNTEDNDENKYEFDFFSEKRLKTLMKSKSADYVVLEETPNQIPFPTMFKENDNYWFRMASLLQKKDGDLMFSLGKIFKDDFHKITALTSEFNKFLDYKISYYEISKEMSDKALDIFVRVNSGGQMLDKSDLLFSMLVSSTKDNIRDKITVMISDIKSNYKDAESIKNINKDVFMRLCLCLFSDNVTYNLKNFKGEKGKEIMDNIVNKFDDIKDSLIKSIEFLCRYCGYKKLKGLSTYPIIIVAYMIYNNKSLNAKLIKELADFINLANLKNIFSGSSDVTLGQIRNIIKSKNNKEIVLDDINKAIKPRKNLDISENDIDDMLNYDFRKNYNYIFNILWLIQGNLNEENTYHIDHIYPKSLGEKSKNEELINTINSIANTQMLFFTTNIEKLDKNPKEWLDSLDGTVKNIILECNLINYDDLVANDDLEGIKGFIENRKVKLKEKLIKRFL